MKRLLLWIAFAGSFLTLSSTAVAQGRPPDSPLECHGTAGMASTSGTTVIINFRISGRLAGPELPAGSCAWRDRRFRWMEPARIMEERTTAGDARNLANRINAGETWTFWVFSTGRFFFAAVSEEGAPKDRPMPFDE